MKGLCRVVPLAVGLAWVWLGTGCGKNNPDEGTSAPQNTEPRSTIEQLLATHHLLGKQPEQRTKKERDADVDEETVARFFADSRDFDPFIADLYRGFVLGALARHQSRLFIDTRGFKAQVHAGNARIVMQRRDGLWKVVLAETIPPDIAKRAVEEKKAYEKVQEKSASAPNAL